MWQSKDVIVVSDLHLAAERDVGLFQADKQLSSFFDWVFQQVPSTVILAGDIFDFLVMEPSADLSNPFDLNSIPDRMLSIVEHHDEVFGALSRLAHSRDHKLILMSGNHDAEMALPAVQRVVEEKLGVLPASASLRWLTLGEAAAIRVGEVEAIIEHGDMYDSWNWVDHDSLRRAACLESRGLLSFATREAQFNRFKYVPPPGSRLVVEFITEQRKRFPWMDILKPEREAVLPILFAFMPNRIKMMGVIDELVNSYSRGLITDIQYKINPSSMVKAAPTTELTQSHFLKWVKSIKQSLSIRKRADERREHLIKKLKSVAECTGFFDIEKPNEYSEKAGFILDQGALAHGANLLVQGHTHSAKAHKIGKGLYLNDGTWGKLMRLPTGESSNDEWSEFLDSLQPVDDSRGREYGFTRSTYVRITDEMQATSASLMEWENDKSKVLSRWLFAAGGWQKD